MRNERCHPATKKVVERYASPEFIAASVNLVMAQPLGA
jgi:hypothetical protein